MSVISRLKVWLTADTKEFEERLNKSKRDVFGVGEALDDLKGRIGRAFTVLAVVEAGRQLLDFGMEVDRVREKVERLTGVDDSALAGEVKAVADVFETDYTEVLRTANTLHRQMGVSFEEAMGLIRKGFAAGLNDSGDFLDQLREYAPQFRSAGVSAAGMVAVLQQATRDGIFSDKGLDAVKEAMLRLRELPTATRDALDGIGLSSREVETALREGTMTIFDVIRQVSEKLNELPASSAAVGTAIADIFGGPGEDAGLAYLQTLKDIDTEHEIVTTNLGKAQEELARSLARLNTASTEVFEGINRQWTSMRTDLADWVATELEVWQSDEIGWFDKLFRVRDTSMMEVIRQKKDENRELIEQLRLQYQDKDELELLLDEYVQKSAERDNYFQETVKAIREELERRSAGVAALTETVVVGSSSSVEKELTAEEKVFSMQERTVEQIQKKVKAIEGLMGTLGVYDTETRAVYQNEVNRLEGVIEKMNEAVNARVRAMSGEVPVMTAQASVGFTGLTSGENPLDLLPEKLEMSTEALQPIAQEMIDISNVINGAFGTMATGVGESIGMLLSGTGDLQGFAALVGSTFADMAIQVGQIAIQTGIAAAGIKAALSPPLNPFAAIAAGVALVALGTAVKGALSGVVSGSNTFAGGTGISDNTYDTRTGADAWDRESRTVDVNVTGEFRLQGNTLVAAVNRENRRKGLTT